MAAVSETEVSQIRTELAQVRAELAHQREQVKQMDATVREIRDTLMQAQGGATVLRYLFGASLLSFLAATAALYSWLKNH